MNEKLKKLYELVLTTNDKYCLWFYYDMGFYYVDKATKQITFNWHCFQNE